MFWWTGVLNFNLVKFTKLFLNGGFRNSLSTPYLGHKVNLSFPLESVTFCPSHLSLWFEIHSVEMAWGTGPCWFFPTNDQLFLHHYLGAPLFMTWALKVLMLSHIRFLYVLDILPDCLLSSNGVFCLYVSAHCLQHHGCMIHLAVW